MRGRIHSAVATALLGLCLLALPSASPAASGKPARTLYGQAQAAEARLHKSTKLQRERAEWEKVVLAYRKVVARYPRSGYCDNSLLAVGNLYRAMAGRFQSEHYRSDAVAAYRMLVKEYPSSSLGDDALWAVVEIERDSGERPRLVRAGKSYLATFPRGKRASKVKTLMQQKAPATRVPAPPPPGLARVFDLRFWSGTSSTRVVLDLEARVKLNSDRVGSPERLWIDLLGTRLHPNLERRVFPVGDGLLERVRIAQNRPDRVRVVLDFKGAWEHSVFYLDSPPRLVIDVKGRPKPPATLADAAAGAPAPPAVPGPAASPPQSAARGGSAPAEAPTPPGAVAAALPPPSPSMPLPPPPAPPTANRAGSYSLARQLGLGARRIVIDPGHGGHDPGTIGRKGLQEKDLVLDVALRLQRLVHKELGAEVVMTRSTDVFVPLEERTAIANTKRADLFLSIHANGVKSSKARGIETYFLSFARSRHAESVAARENAISEGTLKDLQNLVKAITLNSKIDESRDFATSVQEAMVKGVRRTHNVQDRGVHTAPFYVLIGAEMPAVLAELAFVSNPETERRLRTSAYRDLLAESLFGGVKSYLESLNRTQTRKLTSSRDRSRVGGGSGSR
ncbi:MAG: N-acetylmuramoyl-L-alanine amidase [Acidobacteria bacterium]|nr:N-acetylmuramoyl-L-alanine amidase [Acidobacteriota bacterium]